ncbi:hypothetical protein Tco_0789732 [Tanacetum coccineum]
MQSSSVSSDFTEKLLNFKNISPADNAIASLMDTTVRYEEPSGQTSTLFIVPITVIPTTIPPPPYFFNPLPQQVTPTPTPTTSKAMTSFPALPDFSSIFKFNDRVTKLETDRGTKRKKSSKEAESPKDQRSKEGKSSSSSKGTSRSHHKSSGKSAHAEEPSHTVDDFGVHKNQVFDTGNNDEQPDDEAASKNDCVTAPAKKPPTSFDELMDTPIDFSSFVMNWLNITNLTQALLVGPEFNLLKGTCKSLTELEYHFEECSNATTERLNWHNSEGKPYPFDLRKPLPLIPDHRGRQVIPQDYFINNDLEYLKGGSLSKQYSTSVTKTKAATYEIKWIKDMVPNL